MEAWQALNVWKWEAHEHWRLRRPGSLGVGGLGCLGSIDQIISDIFDNCVTILCVTNELLKKEDVISSRLVILLFTNTIVV